MACGKCLGFHGLMSNYTSLALSIPRQAELFSCRNCGQLLEIGALARFPIFLTPEQARDNFPDGGWTANDPSADG